MRTVKIRERVYAIRYTLKSFFIYEEITGEAFSGKRLRDLYILCYATILACNPETFDLEFNEFIDECDEDPEIFGQFQKMLEEKAALSAQLSKKKEMK